MSGVVVEAEALHVFSHIGDGADVAQQVLREFGRMVHRAVVGDVHGLGFEFKQARDGLTHFVGFELGRRGGGEDEYAIIDIQLLIGQAEHVAGEDAFGFFVHDAVVVARMTGGVDAQQFAAIERYGRAVGGFDDALGGDR